MRIYQARKVGPLCLAYISGNKDEIRRFICDCLNEPPAAFEPCCAHHRAGFGDMSSGHPDLPIPL